MNKNDISKYMKKINKSKNNELVSDIKKYVKNFLYRSLICLSLFLLLAIVCKIDTKYKDIIKKNIYETNISFTSIKNFYSKYLGGVSILDNFVSNTKPVFNEKLVYKSSSKYYNGVKLEVENNYLVPVLKSGIVVFIGEKENYGNVIIIQGMDGVDIWYGNMSTTSIKLYDYIESGDLLGETTNNYLYLVYSKNGEYLNYEEYLK